ncbi:MAG: preprotein translocase subunit YajC [Pseudomonadota bacterium]
MLISPAYAQAGGGGAGGFDPIFIFMMVAMFAVFWFFVIRPQQKRAKDHRQMLGALKRGDQIVTNGGIIGRIARIEGDGVLLVEIAPNVKVKCRQSMIADTYQRTEARDDDRDDDKDEKEEKKDS